LFAHLWSAIVLLAIVGIGNALVDVGVFTLLGRLADDAVLARTFAAFEGIITFGVAVGAGLASLSVSALGIRPTLIAIGLIAPLGVLASWRALRALDHRIRARDVDVALLNHIAMLRPLPTVTIEQLATRLTRARFASGEAVFEQDERGDDFYVIERGRAQVICDGQTIGVLGSGDSFGEIALLRDCRRTAGVRAVTSLTLRALNRTAFVAAVTGYSESADAADRLIVHELSRASPNSAR
jgi:MFS family permease